MKLRWWQNCILAIVDATGACFFTHFWSNGAGNLFMLGGTILTVGACIALALFFYVKVNGEDIRKEELEDAEETETPVILEVEVQEGTLVQKKEEARPETQKIS